MGDKVLLPEYGGTKVTMEEKVYICFILFVLFWWGVGGYDLRAWRENGVIVTKSSLLLGGYFEHDWVFCYNTTFQTFVLHLHFFSQQSSHIFGKEMKNYTGDQKII